MTIDTTENSSWGYDRIVGVLANPGYTLSDETVGNILRRNAIPPAPERMRTGAWKDFIRAHDEISLRRALREYLTHFHHERNHQGKGNVLLFPSSQEPTSCQDQAVRCRERLGGLLKYYYRQAV